jgi:hypothetical protein
LIFDAVWLSTADILCSTMSDIGRVDPLTHWHRSLAIGANIFGCKLDPPYYPEWALCLPKNGTPIDGTKDPLVKITTCPTTPNFKTSRAHVYKACPIHLTWYTR